MKVYMKNGIQAVKGKVDGMSFYTVNDGHLTIGRRLPLHFTPVEQHEYFKQANIQVGNISPHDDYKQDFRMYLASYRMLPGEHRSFSSWYNLYISMLWDMDEAGVVQLNIITRELIYTNNLPCISVKAAVEAGFLPQVYNYELLDKQI